MKAELLEIHTRKNKNPSSKQLFSLDDALSAHATFLLFFRFHLLFELFAFLMLSQPKFQVVLIASLRHSTTLPSLVISLPPSVHFLFVIVTSSFSHRTVGQNCMKSTRGVLGHSLVHLLVRSHRSLIRLLRTARFARPLTRSGAHGKEIYVYELNASISCTFGP